MIAGLKQTPLWQGLRGVKRTLLAPRVEAALAAEACRGGISLVSAPVALEAKQAFTAKFKLENKSAIAWASAGAKPIVLRWEWFTHDGRRFASGPHDDASLARPLFPGEPQEITLDLLAPAFVGDFILKVSFAQAERFGDCCEVAIPVVGPRATDIDYHAVYRTADLAANHWWVVGAYHSLEQYEKSSRDRLNSLIEHGLTPDSRVLDIGCGTGQMAKVLLPYLSERGGYSGTDIGREAIDYCNRTFQKRNFQFRVGGMTTVPFDDDATHDLAIFFSVFTHTFTDESALLLAETARLLKPGGLVIADVIASPLVERGAGHRGEMIVNAGHFLRLAAIAGFTHAIIGRWPWNDHAERLMFRLRKS